MMRRLAHLLGLALALLAGASGAADAQGFRGGRGGGTPGQFDFYVLALSWSPAFCQSEAGQRNRTQCGRDQRSEFVVHGLWPQYERGFPSDCSTVNRSIPRMAMDKAAAIFPDERLARYEWNKHGTCSGLSPSEYFDNVADARAKVVVPAQFHQPASDVETSPMEVERSFTAANRGLRADMMAVQCTRGLMTEVRICMSKDLRSFVPCPEVNRSSCRAREITAPSAR